MTFYLRREWIDQHSGIDRVLLHYACTPLGEQPDWLNAAQAREMIPESGVHRKRRAKVIKLPRRLNGCENYSLHYYYETQGAHEEQSRVFVEPITCDDSFTYVDYTGEYTNICVYWSINGWGAHNYSSMFEASTRLDHPMSSLHYYGRAKDGVYIYERYKYLQSLPLPHVFHGKVHGPRGAHVVFCYHILRQGSPDGYDYAFWDNNEGLDFWKELK